MIIMCIPLASSAQCLGGDCPPSSKHNKNKNWNIGSWFKKEKKPKKRKAKSRTFDSKSGKTSKKTKKHKTKPPIPDANPDGMWAPSNY